MKRQLTVILSLITFSVFSQQGTGTFQYLDVQRRMSLAGRTVKGISIDTALVNASVDSLVTQYALKGYLTNRMGPGIPFGEQHQLLGAKFDNSNVLEYLEPLVDGAFVTSDSELAAAKLIYIDQQTIFSTWKRFSHGAGAADAPALSNDIPGVPIETNSWSFNDVTNQINSTLNSISFIGFISPEKFTTYNNTLRLSAQAGATFSDNDFVISVIAYIEDANDMVVNKAYGLNPNDFSWPINTTSPFIPNQHTLSLIRGRTTQGRPQYAIVYDLGKTAEQVLINGSSLVWNTNNPYNGHYCDVQVIRNGDIIKTYTTDWNDAPGGVGAMSHELILDLSVSALTQKFRGAASYGYGALSQENSAFTNLSISNNQNVIYDVRNGDKWIADANGNYSLDTGSYYNDYGIRRFLHNPATNKTIYVKKDKSFLIIGGGYTPYTSDTTGRDWSFNEPDFIVDTTKKVSLRNPGEPLFLASVASAITAADTLRYGRKPVYLDSITYLSDRDFYGTGDTVKPIFVRQMQLTTTGTGAASWDSASKILNIPASATASRFGIEDSTSTVNRRIDMGGFNMNFNNAGSFNAGEAQSFFFGRQVQTGRVNVSLSGSSSTRFMIMGINDYVNNNAAGFRLFNGVFEYFKSTTSGTGELHYLPLTINGQYADVNGNIDVTATGGSSGVTSFNSRTGVVVPDVADYSAYYAAISHTHTASQITDFMSAARGAISLTTTGTTGAATYDNSTGVLNIPNYATSGGSGWNLGGNTLTNSGTQYFGTNNNTSLRIKTNNTQAMVIDSIGNVAIGAIQPSSTYKLDVQGAGRFSVVGGVSLWIKSGSAIRSDAASSGSLLIDASQNLTGTVTLRGTNVTINGLLNWEAGNGMVLRNLTATQRGQISSPSKGQVIYNTDTNLINYWNGTAWMQISATTAP